MSIETLKAFAQVHNSKLEEIINILSSVRSREARIFTEELIFKVISRAVGDSSFYNILFKCVYSDYFTMIEESVILQGDHTIIMTFLNFAKLCEKICEEMLTKQLDALTPPTV